MLAGIDANAAGRLFPKRAQGDELSLDLIEPRADGEKQAFTRLRRRDAPRRARQQSQPEPLLEPVDRMAERRLRHTELRRRLREVFCTGNGKEGDQVIDGRTRHL